MAEVRAENHTFEEIEPVAAEASSRLKLDGRGSLAVGAFADVAVFDPDTVLDVADFADPFQYARGIKATVVNGGVSFLDGERGARTGRALRASA